MRVGQTKIENTSEYESVVWVSVIVEDTGKGLTETGGHRCSAPERRLADARALRRDEDSVRTLRASEPSDGPVRR